MATASAETGTPITDREQIRREMKIAAPYRGDFAWRLVFEAVWTLGGWVAVIAFCMAGYIPYWLGCLVNGWFAYCSYMCLHEGTHGNHAQGRADLRWVDDVIGSLAQIPLWFSYWAHKPSHMQHHAHTNDPSRDPDFFVAGSFREIPKKFALMSFLQIAGPLASLFTGGPAWLRRLLASSAPSDGEHPEFPVPSEYEMRASRRFNLACLGAFALLSLAGFFKEAFLLWYLPSRIGFFLIVVVFAWLPHHPHNERGRYRDTRVTLFPGATALIRGQNHHVLHHMFPRVPHYSLPALFDDMRPILEQHGVRIEGSLAGPDAPPMQLR
jgi:beta-carotene hydroxylase